MAIELMQAIAGASMPDDEREGRYYGFKSGIVKEVETNNLGRVKARLEGMGDNDVTDWLVPFLPGSMEAIPEKNDPVIVGFIDGDPNRGFYGWAPQKATKKRPADFMVLGLVMLGLHNDLVAQFNQLRTDFNTFIGSTYNMHQHVETGGTTNVTLTTGTSTTATAAAKAQDADGSDVPAKSTASKALSKHLKLRGHD